jgi:hypothetical protein
VQLESKQTLPDGTTEVKKTINNIARDLQGRIYNERRKWMSPSVSGAPLLLSAHIYDPVTGLNTFLDPATRIARQTARFTREVGQEVVAAPQEAKNGTPGNRTTKTILAAESGTGKPVVVSDEYWYSEELHLNMLVKHTDPRTGEQTVTVTHVDRNEPSSTTFQIPAGYKVVDETPEK